MPKKKEQNIWFGRYVFWGLSAIWGCIALFGFWTYGWIGRMSYLTPAELVVQLGALMFPVGVFGLLAVYLDRNKVINDSMKASKAYLEELLYPSDLGAAYIDSLNGELKQQIQLFRSSFTEVSQQTNQVKENLTEWIENLNKIIVHMDKQTQNMAGYVQQLASAAAEAQEQSSEAGRYLAGQADILMQVGTSTEKQLLETGKQLQSQSEAISQNVHAVMQSEKSMTNSLDKSSRLINALEENAHKIEKAMKSTDSMRQFLSDTDKVLLRFKEIGTTLDLRLKALKQEKGTGEKEIIVKNNTMNAKEFTENMQLILDKLQGISVEMISVFQPKNEAELWDRYYAGDKAVFMRYINEDVKTAKRQKILDLVHSDATFQENVQNYMAAFEDLTKGLGDSPWLGVLVGSDPGRLYMLLASLMRPSKSKNKQKETQ